MARVCRASSLEAAAALLVVAQQHVTRHSLTRDLEEMRAKGYAGAIIVDAGSAEQGQNSGVPAGPVFASAEWRALYRHAIAEAKRLGLELSLNI